MIRVLTALVALGLAGVATAAEHAGIPLAQLSALGVATPTLDVRFDAWRAGLPGGGFVSVELRADESDAISRFVFLQKSGTTIPQPDLPDVGDEAVGDGVGYVLARFGNIVVMVRSHTEPAREITERLAGALVETAPPGVFREVTHPSGAVERWDTVGRRIP